MKLSKRLLSLLLAAALGAGLTGCGKTPAVSGGQSSVPAAVSQTPNAGDKTEDPAPSAQPEASAQPETPAPTETALPEQNAPVEPSAPEGKPSAPTGKPSAPSKPAAPAKTDAPAKGGALTMRYDDRLDVSGKTVQIVDPGTPTSYQVGFGLRENQVSDVAVVTLADGVLTAAGIGTAVVSIDGVLHDVTVKSAPISLLLLIGQSNMQGSEGNAAQSIICPDGEVYATYGDRYNMNVNNATGYAASALTGPYRDINVNGTTEWLESYPIYSLNEAGKGKAGPDSGYGYEWVKSTGEKVWVVNAAHGGSKIKTWLEDGENYQEAIALFSACQETLRKEIAAGHFTLSHMGYFWCQGCSDETRTAEAYVNDYLTMHKNLKAALSADMDSDPSTPDQTLEFGNIVITLAGHARTTGYRYEDGVYNSKDAVFFMTYEELEMRCQRVAQLWMAANPELADINMVCNLGDSWVTMPDGSDRVAEYFLAHYKNGRVDYRPQEEQSEEWYAPTTPKAVKDSIHYNQIGYNEVGREAVRNTLYLLGVLPEPNVPTTVKFVDWTGYRTVSALDATTVGRSSTLVVPVVSPIYRTKQVTYQLSDGLHYDYYDLTADTRAVGGTLTAVGAQGSVTVNACGYTTYQWDMEGGVMTSGGERENKLTLASGTVSGSKLQNAYYTLYDPFLLSRDQKWALEWKMADPEPGAAFDLFCGEDGSISVDKDGAITFTVGQTTLTAPKTDLTGAHIYRLANRDDGIYLTVDGTQIGKLGQADDLQITALGRADGGITCGALEYVAVREADAPADLHFHDWGNWSVTIKATRQSDGAASRVCTTCGRTEEKVLPAHVSYRWELKGDQLVSTGERENALTQLDGTIKDGVFDQVRYQMEKRVTLARDKDWAVEFKLSGEWKNDVSRKLLSSDGESTSHGALSIMFNSASKRITLSQYDGSRNTHFQYGQVLGESFDMTQPHVYRIVNRPNEAGEAVITLYVDGTEIGSMHQRIKDTFTENLPAHLDFDFGYVSTKKYDLSGGTLHYLEVVQSGATEVQ